MGDNEIALLSIEWVYRRVHACSLLLINAS